MDLNGLGKGVLDSIKKEANHGNSWRKIGDFVKMKRLRQRGGGKRANIVVGVKDALKNMKFATMQAIE